MCIVFVGGPWHGATDACADPAPDRITAGPDARYVPWANHAATAGVLGGPLQHAHPYVLETLMPPHLLERVQDLLLHGDFESPENPDASLAPAPAQAAHGVILPPGTHEAA